MEQCYQTLQSELDVKTGGREDFGRVWEHLWCMGDNSQSSEHAEHFWVERHHQHNCCWAVSVSDLVFSIYFTMVKDRGIRNKVIRITKLKEVWSTYTTLMLIHREELSCCHANLVLSHWFISFLIQILILIILPVWFNSSLAVCIWIFNSCIFSQELLFSRIVIRLFK